MPDIKIIENTSEIAAGTRGASLGVAALKVASLKSDNDYFGRYERFRIETENDGKRLSVLWLGRENSHRNRSRKRDWKGDCQNAGIPWRPCYGL